MAGLVSGYVPACVDLKRDGMCFFTAKPTKAFWFRAFCTKKSSLIGMSLKTMDGLRQRSMACLDSAYREPRNPRELSGWRHPI